MHTRAPEEINVHTYFIETRKITISHKLKDQVRWWAKSDKICIISVPVNSMKEVAERRSPASLCLEIKAPATGEEQMGGRQVGQPLSDNAFQQLFSSHNSTIAKRTM